jgi:hypothetical protein
MSRLFASREHTHVSTDADSIRKSSRGAGDQACQWQARQRCVTEAQGV